MFNAFLKLNEHGGGYACTASILWESLLHSVQVKQR